MLLEEVTPVSAHLEHHLRVDTAVSRGLLHRVEGALQHGETLLLALLDGALDLVLEVH